MWIILLSLVVIAMNDTQLDDIGAWKAQIRDMAAEIAARYPDWALARTIGSHLELVVCELARLASNVRLNDPVFIESAVGEYRRERALRALREREEQERALRERLERARVRHISEESRQAAREMRRAWYRSK